MVQGFLLLCRVAEINHQFNESTSVANFRNGKCVKQKNYNCWLSNKLRTSVILMSMLCASIQKVNVTTGFYLSTHQYDLAHYLTQRELDVC